MAASLPKGCCVDCGNNRLSCDETCIRKLAAANCRGSSHADLRQSSDPPRCSVSGDCAKTKNSCSNTQTTCAETTTERDLAAKSQCNTSCASESGLDAAKTSTQSQCAAKACCSSPKPLGGAEGSPCASGSSPSSFEKVNHTTEATTLRACDKKASACLGSKTKKISNVSCCAVEDETTCMTNKETEMSSSGACQDHLERAFNEYAKYLERGLCICRSVLDRLDKCCGIPRTSTKEDGRPRASCGVATSIASPASTIPRRAATGSCEKACCDSSTEPVGVHQDSSESSGSAKSGPQAPAETTKQTDVSYDIETGVAREHIMLGVSGMTCTGCARKVTNVLNNVDGVSAINVTFVTGMAEFDLDTKAAALPNVLVRIQKETGFGFSKVDNSLQILDVAVEPQDSVRVMKVLHELCASVEKVGKTTYRISYDPTTIGARNLLSAAPGSSLSSPTGDGKLLDGRRRLIRMAWSTSLATLLTIPIVVLAWSDSVVYSTSGIIELVLGTFVQAIAVPEFYAGAVKSLIYSRVLEMDMLVVISITAAYCYSIIAFALDRAGYVLHERAFFETSSLLITLVLLGRLIAAIAKVRAVSAVSVRSLQAEKALVHDTESGDTTEIDARLLQLGDVFVVAAHSTVPTDGEIISGSSAVDESMITGESVPVPKTKGDQVIAGTVNGPGSVTVRLTRLPGKNSITDIAGLVEGALAAKPRVQELADKVASYFIPAVVTIAVIVFAIWIAVSFKLRGLNGGGAVGLSITYGIAVLAVSCPCALGLAVPMVLVVAGGVAARSGVIIKQADAIERGYKVTDVVFDKTGTITTGQLEIVHSQFLTGTGDDEDDIKAVTRSLVQDNQHPVSQAVAAHLQKLSKWSVGVTEVTSIPGAGIEGLWQGRIVKAGNPYWLGVEHTPSIASLIAQSMTLLCVTVNAVPVAVYGLKSQIRPEAANVVAELHKRGLVCHVVSGDTTKVVEDVANAVGIPLENVASKHLPGQKQNYVKALMEAQKVVLFCGDGTNDAVAVAQANIGVQIGQASAVTRGTADVVLLGGLDGLPTLLTLSKRSFRRIIFNFVWSAIYNVFAILLAAGAFVKVRIPPAYAGLGEIISVVPVILVAVSLTRA